jgi:hypothetical protein
MLQSMAEQKSSAERGLDFSGNLRASQLSAEQLHDDGGAEDEDDLK